MSLLTAAAAAVTLVGCSASAPTAAIAPSTPAVPEGVAAQYAQVNEEIRAEGGETTSGEWRIGYIVEPAEPWHVVAGSGHTFRDPAPGETHHIEIVPFEKSTGRIIPDVPIRLEVLDGSGKVVEAKSLNFYYAEFFHYANNFSIPAPGRYTLRAKLDAPTFPRHGESTDTPPLSSGVTVEFRNVELAG
jgi:hypothetical protein